MKNDDVCVSAGTADRHGTVVGVTMSSQTNTKNHVRRSTVDIEPPYFDMNGVEIKEFALIKVFHFKGVNSQGRGRKNYYMYKWVRLNEDGKGKKWWVALHLNDDNNDYYHLRSVADKETRFIKGTEIVQQKEDW